MRVGLLVSPPTEFSPGNENKTKKRAFEVIMDILCTEYVVLVRHFVGKAAFAEKMEETRACRESILKTGASSNAGGRRIGTSKMQRQRDRPLPPSNALGPTGESLCSNRLRQ